MSDWTHGYVVEVDYTFGYFDELNPLRVALPFLSAGLIPPPIAYACELGYGQGVSANVHAAASDSCWYGTDFNASHAVLAQTMAAAAGSDARLFDQSFAEFCARPDLPEFDFIGLHGVWSWISDENRHVIVDFIRRKLRVGGVLYVSYNTQPGCAALVPIRHLLTQHAKTMAPPGSGIIARIDAALDFAERLSTLNPLFARTNPMIAARIKQMKGQNRQYLAHEYFNRDWYPLPVAAMAEWLAPAKLTYACSANYLDVTDGVNLSPEQQRFLADIPDPLFRQSVRDFIVDQTFRRDYWVKGARRASPAQRAELLRLQSVILTTGRGEFVAKLSSARGQSDLAEIPFSPVLDVLADHKPRAIGEIERVIPVAVLTPAQVREIVMLLVGKGDVALVQDDAVRARAKPKTERLNLFVVDRARGSGEVRVLSSPVTGGGVAVPRAHQLFLWARGRGRTTPQEWAESAWEILSSQGQRLIRDGKTLTTPEENLTRLAADARHFADKRLPVLQALQIA